MRLTISSIEETRPPGVSSRRTTAAGVGILGLVDAAVDVARHYGVDGAVVGEDVDGVALVDGGGTGRREADQEERSGHRQARPPGEREPDRDAGEHGALTPAAIVAEGRKASPAG
jgi:hypothetical protein